VVDDERHIVEFVAMSLEGRGMEVRSAPDSRAALDAFEEFRPDVVVLDLMLPGLSGFAEFERETVRLRSFVSSYEGALRQPLHLGHVPSRRPSARLLRGVLRCRARRARRRYGLPGMSFVPLEDLPPRTAALAWREPLGDLPRALSVFVDFVGAATRPRNGGLNGKAGDGLPASSR